MKPRRYTLKSRAESKEATRARIVAATMALHESLGPKNTTISAVAEKAGVQRLTVYRHFPNEAALFAACTSQWLSEHPPPDPSAWQTIADEEERVRAALSALYDYYRATERMWTAAVRDEHEVAALRGPMRKFRRYLDDLAADLARGRGKAAAATLRHAVQFETWRSFAGLGLRNAATVDLVAGWLPKR